MDSRECAGTGTGPRTRPSSGRPGLVPERDPRPGSPQTLIAQHPLGRVSGDGGPSCGRDGHGCTALLKPFDLGCHPSTDITSTKGAS
jgi:hypothetical protein